MDAGDTGFAPGLVARFKRACRIGALRDRLGDHQLAAWRAKFVKKLSQLPLRQPTHEAGAKLRAVIAKIRRNLFLFVTNRALAATNNESERAPRPRIRSGAGSRVTFRKITGGFRTAWGAGLYADIRSVPETARRRAISPLQAIVLTLKGSPLPLQTA